MKQSGGCETDASMLGASVRSPDGKSFQWEFEWIGGDGSFRLVRLSAGVADFYLVEDQSTIQTPLSRVERDELCSRLGLRLGREQITGIRVVLSYGVRR